MWEQWKVKDMHARKRFIFPCFCVFWKMRTHLYLDLEHAAAALKVRGIDGVGRVRAHFEYCAPRAPVWHGSCVRASMCVCVACEPNGECPYVRMDVAEIFQGVVYVRVRVKWASVVCVL